MAESSFSALQTPRRSAVLGVLSHHATLIYLNTFQTEAHFQPAPQKQGP